MSRTRLMLFQVHRRRKGTTVACVTATWADRVLASEGKPSGLVPDWEDRRAWEE